MIGLMQPCLLWDAAVLVFGVSYMTESKELDMPFWLKLNMTIKEAAVYSNIGINRIEELLKEPKCNFVLYVGNKKLVKRKEFEQYVSKSVEL